jgi:hypothetical protein
MMVILFLLNIMGCAARGTYDFLNAEQQYLLALESKVVVETPPEDPREPTGAAVYEWTLAEQYMKKAWEEYSNSEYEQAANFANIALEWTQLAQTSEQSSMGAQN